MNASVNLFSSKDQRQGLERTGRVGSTAGANQYELDENEIMVPKSVANPGSLSMKIQLD